MQATRLGVREPLLTTQRTFSSNSPPRRAFRPAPPTSNTLENLDREFTRLQLEDAPAPSNTMRVALESFGANNSGLHNIQHAALNRATTHQPVSTKEAESYPLYSYKKCFSDAQIIYIRTEDKANAEVSKLQGPLGFDLEWRALFAFKAPQRKTAVLQLCDKKRILIIQLSAMKTFPWKVKEILESPDIIKMGANIMGDGKKLERDFGISARGLLELSHLAHAVDPERVTSLRMVSLRTIVEMYTGHTLCKGPVRTSNWEAFLSHGQLAYAANDAHSALSVYNNLLKMAQERNLSLRPIPTVDGRGITYTSPRKPSIKSRSQTITAAKSRVSVSVSSTIVPNIRLGSQKPGSLLSIGLAGCTEVAEGDAVSSSSGAQTDNSVELSTNSKVEKPMCPRFRRAYELWHHENLSLDNLRSALRSPEKPLAKSTVISYVLSALTADRSLSFSRERLIKLVQNDKFSWQKNRWWIQRLPSESFYRNM